MDWSCDVCSGLVDTQQDNKTLETGRKTSLGPRYIRFLLLLLLLRVTSLSRASSSHTSNCTPLSDFRSRHFTQNTRRQLQIFFFFFFSPLFVKKEEFVCKHFIFLGPLLFSVTRRWLQTGLRQTESVMMNIAVNTGREKKRKNVVQLVCSRCWYTKVIYFIIKTERERKKWNFIYF